MINSEKFSKRLHKLIDFYGLSASAFADKIGVQRSSISHILSGRNKPSLDFVLKVISEFPEVDLYWLLNGVGSFPLPAKEEKNSTITSSVMKTKDSIDNSNKEIDRIVIFYRDGTFKHFVN